MEEPKLTSLSDEQQTQVSGGSLSDRQSCPYCGGKGYIVNVLAGGSYSRKPCGFCSGFGNITAIAYMPGESSLFDADSIN